MTSFVESCIETVTDSATAVARRARGRPTAARLLRSLAGKKNILVTTHIHPDPDALASALGMVHLLKAKLGAGGGSGGAGGAGGAGGTGGDVKVEMAIKGQIAGGINEAFARNSNIVLAKWDEGKMVREGDPAGAAGSCKYDAIVLLDCQPGISYNPVPAGVTVTNVVDHHRTHGRGAGAWKKRCKFCDIRTDVGATSSIVFSYCMELEVEIPPVLGASLLYAIESDLAGAAGTPGELDNVALAGLTLIADTKTLYRMRYVKLNQSYYEVFAEGIAGAMVYDKAVISHLHAIDSLEKPAVLADSLLRYDKAEWTMVTAVHEKRLVVSLRSSSPGTPAADVMAKLMRGLGDGGGHRAKAGGSVALTEGTEAEIERVRTKLRQRFLRAIGIGKARGTRLIAARD